ncbi:Hypothetical predicted protein [Mytilus galloprovincialis]|uniref:Transmembrane protein 188 n=1 Tax=Mytilus galloprovincialis TaxID=29158 RepID=A0A8B6BYK4_MYTGA|nr:Hypothetical predicted protein [Mytilus galloprovincialis]
MSAEQTEDLKAFERRLTEVIDKVQPTARLWRMVLIVISVCTAAGAGTWLLDPYTTKVYLSTSLWNHPCFTISCIVLLMLFLCGIHKRVVAPSMYPLYNEFKTFDLCCQVVKSGSLENHVLYMVIDSLSPKIQVDENASILK